MKQPPVNLAASVRQRLLERARREGRDLGLLLARFGIERLLYRISRSSQADRFCLKGAHLFAAWTGDLHRPTRDVDFLAFGSPALADVKAQFTEILAETKNLPGIEDGLSFLTESISTTEIRKDRAYGGVRVKLTAILDRARIPLQIDLGFGDAVTPGPVDVELPSMLDFPSPRLRGYPVSTVIAEKLETVTSLGLANSRMKDFYDLWIIAQTFEPHLAETAGAVRHTFARRGTAIQTEPAGLTAAYWDNAAVQRMWKAFVEKGLFDQAPASIHTLLSDLKAFTMPLLEAALANADPQPHNRRWHPGAADWVPIQIQ